MGIKKVLRDYYYLSIKKMDVSDYNILKMRKNGISIGKNCRIFTEILSNEPQLIIIGNNVTISSEVKIITHDNAISKSDMDYSDIVGPVSIGNNCFIGIGSIILPGVSIGNNCIVGGGAVVSKSVPDGYVVAGNPAKIVCSSEEYFQKNCKFGIQYRSIKDRDKFFKLNPNKLIKKPYLVNDCEKGEKDE